MSDQTLANHLARVARHMAAAFSLAACSPGSGGAFTPLGSASDLYGEWDINGKVPDAAVCAEAGIAAVSVVYQPMLTSPARDVVAPPSFEFPCADGFFDTGNLAVVRAGSYAYRWRALAADGAILLESNAYAIVAVEGQEFVLHAVNFVRVAPHEIDAALTFAGDLGPTTCAAALVDRMAWELREGGPNGTIRASSNGTVPCAENLVVNEPTGVTWSEGGYTLVVTATASDGAAWSANCAISLPLGGPSNFTCDVTRAP